MTTELPVRLPMLGLEGIVLKGGAHGLREDGVCAMEAVAWVAGEPHSDHPQCACPVIGAFMRTWNDNLPDDETRTRILRPLLPLLLNTRSTKAVELQRSFIALDWLARDYTPAWLSLTDSLKAHAVALRGLAPLESDAACKAAQPALSAALSAARSAAGLAARSAAGSSLAPTVAALQVSAADLVRRMVAITA